MAALQMYYPTWREAKIHEGSPVWIGPSKKFFKDSPQYSWSYYTPDCETGKNHPAEGWRNENLEAMTFPAESFDLFITQDVFEHVFEPHRAIAEIARVLRPGGMHICTVPIVNGTAPSKRRARLTHDGIEHFTEPSYHGDPINASGTLVTIDWGYDIAARLDRHSGLHTTVVKIEDQSRGILGVASEVLVMCKQSIVDHIL